MMSDLSHTDRSTIDQERKGSSKAILLADDDEVVREIVGHLLSPLQNVELVTAVDGKAALEAAMGRKFDLMIFDRNMPHIPGDRVLCQIKAAQTINATTPVIQFTADADAVAIGRSAVSLADAVLPKPISAKDFLAIVSRFLGA